MGSAMWELVPLNGLAGEGACGWAGADGGGAGPLVRLLLASMFGCGLPLGGEGAGPPAIGIRSGCIPAGRADACICMPGGGGTGEACPDCRRGG